MLAIEISKRSGDFTVWDDKRIKNAFNFGNGTIKHFEAYMSNNKCYCTFITEKSAFAARRDFHRKNPRYRASNRDFSRFCQTPPR